MADGTPAVFVSVAKFNHLITEALTQSPKKVKELYGIALERQPQDCPDVICPHRKKTNKSMEWQHEIQRQLARIAVNRDGLWHLKALQPASLAEVEPEVTPVVTVNSDIVIPAPTVVVFDKPYTGDPFISVGNEECPSWARSGFLPTHFMDVEELKEPIEDRFVVPNNFDEFYAWKPDFVLAWVKRRLNRFVVDEEIEDWTQDLLIHLRYLPQGSKHRQPGANGRLHGCQDVIETYDPLQQYGASERRWRSYYNNILGNKFLTVHSKRQKNPVLRQGNIPFGVSGEHDSEIVAGDEFVHQNSDFLAGQTTRLMKQHDDKLFTGQFKAFVAEVDPSVYPALSALESTGTIGEAARFMNVSDGEFTRYRNRLKQLGECFENGTMVPKQRRPYKKRTKATGEPQAPTV